MKQTNEVYRRIVRRCLALSAMLLLAGGAAHAGIVKQDFFLPIPEDQLQLAFTTIRTGAGNTMHSVFSVVITSPDTVLYYDQWENGYDADMAASTNVWSTANPGGTQVWGDGNDANGIPPGFAHDTNFWAGTVLTLTNIVTLPRNPAVIRFDGRDHLGSTKAIIMTRAAWPVTPGSVQGCAVEVPSVIDHGAHYICPVGEDVASNNKFLYVGLFVMANFDGTTVTVDPDGPGAAAPVVMTLNKGGTYQLNGGIKKGGYVKSSMPVQVNMITGDKTMSYESRSYTLRPVEKWSNRYLTPVGTANNGNPAIVILFNTNASPMTVAYSSQTGSGLLTVPGNNGVLHLQVPRNAGTLFTSTNGMPFSAICAAGADPANDAAFDWGFSLLPFDGLTTEAVVGWGDGSSDLTRNGSPVWVTVPTNTTVYVDYRGDHAGPVTDASGGKCDVALGFASLQSRTIYVPGTNNTQTALRLYTLDGTPVSATWGEDPSVASAGNPFLDMGTAVLPFPMYRITKLPIKKYDNPPPGFGTNDVIDYQATFENRGVLPALSVVVLDNLQWNLTYSNNSSTANGVPIPDDTSGTAFPFDAPGYTIPYVEPGGSNVFTFTCIVTGTGAVNNAFSSGGITVSNSLPVPRTCSAEFTDAARNPVTFYSVGDLLFVRLADEAANTSPIALDTVSLVIHNVTSNDNETLTAVETGPNTGVFFPPAGLPSATNGAGSFNGVLRASPGDTISITYTNLDGELCTATAYFGIQPNTNAQTKVLYLSDPSNTMDRIDPVATGDSTTTNRAVTNVVVAFTQNPPFSMPCVLPAGGTIVISNFITNVVSGGVAPTNIVATLSAGGTTFFAASNAVYGGAGVISNLVWTGILSADVTIASNQAITLSITNAQAGVTSFQILYDSLTYPSKVLMPTTNVIGIAAIDVYDQAYSNGTPVVSSTTGALRFVRITVTDPFGAYDISGVDLLIDGPGTMADVTTNNIAAVASNSLSKTFEYQWQTTTNAGTYVVFATAREGAEGIVARATLSHDLVAPNTRTPSTTEFMTGSNSLHTLLYQTNETIFVRVSDFDRNTNSLTTQSVTVIIRSGDGDAETRVLWETAPNSGMFTGSVAAISTGGVTTNDGTLTASAGSSLIVTYADPDEPDDVSGDTATVRAGARTKVLYQTDTNALDRIDPVATGDGTVAQTPIVGGVQNFIGVDRVSTGFLSGNNAYLLTIPHTTGSATNRLMLVGVSVMGQGASVPLPTNVTYGAQVLTNLGSAINGLAGMQIWALKNPAVGTTNVVVVFNPAFQPQCAAVVGVATFTNVSQATSFPSLVSNVGATAFITLPVLSASGDLVFDSVAVGSPSLIGTFNPTKLWMTNFSTKVGAGGSTKPGAASVTMSWTNSPAADWSIGAVSIKAAVSALPNAISFTQTPSFHMPFSLVAGTVVSITNYIAVTAGTMPTNPNIVVTLSAGGTTFLTISNPVFDSSQSNLAWTGSLPSSVLIPVGQAIILNVENKDTPEFRIYYDSTNYPSKVLLPTTNAISISSLAVYDTGGTPVSSLPRGEARYVRVTVTDPFGASDINGVDLTISATGGIGTISVSLSNVNVTASNSYSKTYEYPWTPAVVGAYSIFATAHEGTEGVTDQSALWHSVTPAGRTPASAEFTASINGAHTGRYPTNSTVYVRVTDLDLDINQGVVETNVATITDNVSGDSETIVLIETSTNSGVFAGSLPASALAGINPNDGTILAPAGSTISVIFVDPYDNADVALGTALIDRPPGAIKPLYLSEPGEALDRSDPVASGDASTTNTPVTNRFVFTQSPSFALPFMLVSNEMVTITNYLSISSGALPASPAVIATLSTGAAPFITLSNAIFDATGSNIVWTGIMPATVVVGSNQAVTLTVTNGEAGVTFSILYDSATYPSKILLPATNVIAIESLGVYDLAGNQVLGSALNGQPLRIRIAATDPFGQYDVSGADLAIDGPGTAGDLNVSLSNAHVIATNAWSKTYEFYWMTPPGTGEYLITATVREGTEGINAQSAVIQALTWDGSNTPSFTELTTGPNGPTADSYQTNETVCVRVTDYNLNLNTAVAETVVVTVTNDLSGDRETITLFETTSNSGVFTGSVATVSTGGATTTNGTLTASAGSTITAWYRDPVNPDDLSSDTAVVLLSASALLVQKDLVDPASGHTTAGNMVQFNIRVVNIGTNTQSSVAVTDSYPSGTLSFVSASPMPDTTGASSLTWNNVGPLLPGQRVDISLFFTVASSMTNMADAYAAVVSATGTAAVVVSRPEVTVTKTPLTTNTVIIGSLVQYRIVILNSGNTPVASIPLQDIGDSYQYVTSTVPPDAIGSGLLIWDNIISGSLLNVGAAFTNDLTLRAVKVGAPAANEALVSFALDIDSNQLPNSSCLTGLVVLAASIKGFVYNDRDTNGFYGTNDLPLAGVELNLYTDPLGDGSASNGVLYAGPVQTMADGSYQFLDLPTGSYVVVETDPVGFLSTSSNRFIVNVISLTDYTNVTFFDYQPSPSTYSTFSGTVLDNGSTSGINNILVDLVEDINSNGVADIGEPVRQWYRTDTNGTFLFVAVSVGHWVIRETDPPGFVSISSNQIPVIATAGSLQTNFFFLDYYLLPFLDITNVTMTVANGVTAFSVAGTNNPTVAGGMWVTNATVGGPALFFNSATSWIASAINLATGANIIVVYGANALGVVTNDSVMIIRLEAPPFVAITSPPDGSVVPFRTIAQAISGISTNLVGSMWYSNLWSSGTAAGSFSATNPWSQQIVLPTKGTYHFTVFGTNDAGVPVSNSIGVIRQKNRLIWFTK